jgi:hypothetical protein
MQISEIMIIRDGGTIQFEISDDILVGKYRLQTPFLGEPRPLFHDEHKLDFGSAEEVAVARKLKVWLADNLTDELKQSLAELDDLKVWQNISAKLNKVVPYHRIRKVLHVLAARMP